MSIHELDAKVKNLRELRNFEAEVKSEITAIEDELKAEMLARNTRTHYRGRTAPLPGRPLSPAGLTARPSGLPMRSCSVSTARPPPAGRRVIA